jgi:hypothetical protein
MNFKDFTDLISDAADPVILIEGRRAISREVSDSARKVAAFLAVRFPHLRFRSGNASGSDEAFTAGVLEVAPERLQVIAPYASHRKKQRHPLALYDSPESLSPGALENIKTMTIAATPGNKGLVGCYQRGGKLGSQAACLIRDTMKVAGISGHLDPPTAALFCIDPSNPEAGGTGHTIRVCRKAGVPVIFQDSWAHWL